MWTEMSGELVEGRGGWKSVREDQLGCSDVGGLGLGCVWSEWTWREGREEQQGTRQGGKGCEDSEGQVG